MTLWFDTSDVWGWQRPHLAGIQRVVTMVLGELWKSRSDIRLFRFEPRSRTLVSVVYEELPAIVRVNCGFAPALPRSVGTGAPSALSATNVRPVERPKERFLDLAYRRGPEGVRSAIDNLRFARQDLQYALREWLAPEGRQRDVPPASRTGNAFEDASQPPDRPRFQSGDVCLSLSLTAGFPGYWNAVAANKSSDVPFVQMLHDIELAMQPQWTPARWASFDIWLREVVAHAGLLLTVSRFQQNEIQRYLRSRQLPERPVEVVELGDNPRSFDYGEDRTVPARLASRLPRPFVLFVAGFFPRKNHYAVYQAWRRLSENLGDHCPQLVLVGERPRMQFDVMSQMQRDPLTKDRISIFFDMDDNDLAALYRCCLFTVYPSHYEGWGLPIAESLRFGRYCIASSAASLPEVGGDLVDYVDPFDQMDLYAKLSRAIVDNDYVRSREAMIRQRYRPRNWAETSRQILACVARVGGRSGNV